MSVDQWTGCYSAGWQGEITPESFSHPAKFSRALIRRIYAHAIEQKWVVPGSVIVDPFGGVALGALDAMTHGLNWIGCELEPRFQKLGTDNIAIWQRRYGTLKGFGSARLLQGDSRQLGQVVQAAGLVVGSPPFSTPGCQPTGRGQGVRADYQAGKMKESEPETNYGTSPGQLGAMPAGMPPVACVVGSPPYANQENTPRTSRYAKLPQGVRGLAKATGNPSNYGQSPGQLGALPPGQVEAVIGSPPYEGLSLSGGGGIANEVRQTYREGQNYGDSSGQTGAMQTATFWSAAREIVTQCHALLTPGGHALWVTKRFVRKGKIVEFSNQWLALCESVGFRLVCRHQAMLVTEGDTQTMLFSAPQQKRIERKSFFRRLAEKKGSPPIDYEDVLCLVRP